ncbi:unnamed protein product [Clonostachys solani]|uniref:HNH nuclease domain-containing protein n=1 Tax=Clonostachys solani TaxID=160281 RepID=A0A9N9YYP1_9HYPO|nr:unnamed protein product [Clonostachys solani]
MSFRSPEDRARAALDFFPQTGPTVEEIEASIRFHKADVLSGGEMEGDGLSISDIVERISLAERAQAILTNGAGNNPASTLAPLKLNLAHLAFFLYGDKARLRRVMFSANNLDLCLRSLEPFLKMILQKLRDKPLDNLQSPTTVLQSDSDKEGPLYQLGVKTDKHGNKTKERNQPEADKARQRDQCCIATGCPEIEACHIMPFSANNRPVRLLNLLQDLLTPARGELATSDESFNIFCLEPLTHTSLDKGYCALEWIGLSDKGELDCKLGEETYKTVRLRWHWLPNCIADALGQSYLHERTTRKGDTGRLLKFGNGSSHYAMATAIYKHLTNTSKISSHGVTIARNADFRPLVSGHILFIRVKEEDLDKTRLMIQLQWFALRMVAISGAAEVVDDLDPEPPSSPDELPTYYKMPDFEADELEDVDLPSRGKSFPGQRRPD